MCKIILRLKLFRKNTLTLRVRSYKWRLTSSRLPGTALIPNPASTLPFGSKDYQGLTSHLSGDIRALH